MIIKGTDIDMTRGDDENILVSCPERPFIEGDKVELTVRRLPSSGPAIIHKEITSFVDGKALIQITPEDTNHLPFYTASYDIQATFIDIGVKTIVRPSKFIIGKEETYAD